MSFKDLPILNGRAVKARGRNFENHVAIVLRRIEPDCERNGGRFGNLDRGDIDTAGLGLAVQVKNVKRIQLLDTMDDAWLQAINADVPHSVAVHRYRRGDTFGLHSRNVWSFNEDLALELLETWYRFKTGRLVEAPTEADSSDE